MDDMQPKVSDFGSSREAAKLSTTMIGTPLFAAPEVLGQLGDGYGPTCDVWSFGCIIACVLARSEYPYPKELLAGVNFQALTASVTAGVLVPALPQRQASPLAAVGWACCRLKPSRRPSFLTVTEDLQDERTRQWVKAQK